jgi:hypothetical protein
MSSRPRRRSHHLRWQPLIRHSSSEHVEVYIRCSSPQQHTIALETQSRICREYADKKGWHIVAMYEEVL